MKKISKKITKVSLMLSMILISARVVFADLVAPTTPYRPYVAQEESSILPIILICIFGALAVMALTAGIIFLIVKGVKQSKEN